MTITPDSPAPTLSTPSAKAKPTDVIDLDGVTLALESRAGSVRILHGLDLAVGAGGSIAIVGPSGSGKTSLLMIMAGLERATSGRVHVAGHDFSALDEDGLALARGRDIGIVFQSFHLVPTMTALENVALPIELAGKREARTTAQRLLTEVGLAERIHHFPSQLSGGEQQRVALARAMAPEPKILFADEPTGNLDASTGEAITDMLFRLHRQKGSTLVLVTHDQSLAQRCQRVIRMRDGRIVADERTSVSPKVSA